MYRVEPALHLRSGYFQTVSVALVKSKSSSPSSTHFPGTGFCGHTATTNINDNDDNNNNGEEEEETATTATMRRRRMMTTTRRRRMTTTRRRRTTTTTRKRRRTTTTTMTRRMRRTRSTRTRVRCPKENKVFILMSSQMQHCMGHTA